MLTVFFAIISTLFVLVGLVGVILPIVPGGVPLAWLGLFIFAIGTIRKDLYSHHCYLFVVMLLTIAVDFFAPMLGQESINQQMGNSGVCCRISPGYFHFWILGDYRRTFPWINTGRVNHGKRASPGSENRYRYYNRLACGYVIEGYCGACHVGISYCVLVLTGDYLYLSPYFL